LRPARTIHARPASRVRHSAERAAAEIDDNPLLPCPSARPKSATRKVVIAVLADSRCLNFCGFGEIDRLGRSLDELHCRATSNDIVPSELLGLSYHLRARHRLDWITRRRGDSDLVRPRAN
jgi:hypothetical protein